jgi:hypothetical protein
MTESELKDLLSALLTKKSESRPSHQIIIGFESTIEDLNNVEHFISTVQAELNKSNLGILEIFGIDEDNTNGEFLINCNEAVDVEDSFNQIRPILGEYKFLENSHVVLKVPSDEGGYTTKFEQIRESTTPKEDTDPDPPIPEGFKSKGCIGSLTVALTIGLVILAFLL